MWANFETFFSSFIQCSIGFPYFWADMDVQVTGRRRRYVTTKRRWPRAPAASTTISIDVGNEIEPSDLDLFLTARWGTVAASLGRLWFHAVDHEPWTLHGATVVELSDTAMTAPGLPSPVGAPIVRWAQPVQARFARPVRV